MRRPCICKEIPDIVSNCGSDARQSCGFSFTGMVERQTISHSRERKGTFNGTSCTRSSECPWPSLSSSFSLGLFTPCAPRAHQPKRPTITTTTTTFLSFYLYARLYHIAYMLSTTYYLPPTAYHILVDSDLFITR